MGWTHSLAVCQNVFEGLAQQVPGVNPENSLVDKKVAPPMSLMIHIEYVDNLTPDAYQEKLARAAATGVEAKLDDAGLPTQPIGATCGGDSMAWRFSATEHILGFSTRGMWR